LAHKSSYISVLQVSGTRILWLRIVRSAERIHVRDFRAHRGQWAVENGSLQAALKAFVAEHGIAEDTIYSVIPRHDMTARILELPSQDLQEIAGMVALSASEHVPYAPEELAIDQCILGALPGGEARVLAVFVHRDIIDTHLQLLAAAGIEPEQVLLSSACVASAAIAARPGCQERYALVNLASGGLDAVVIRGQQLEYDRGVASNQEWDFAANGEAATEAAIEIRASLGAYRRESEDGENPEALYLCSDCLDVTDATGILTHETGFTCEPALFAAQLVGPGAEKLSGIPMTALGAALTALGRSAITIKLLPETVLQHRARSVFKRKASAMAALILMLIASGWGLYFQAVRQRTALITDLEAQIAQIEPNAKGVVSKQRQLEILQQQVDRKGSVLELLAALCSAAPNENLNISRFTFDHGQEANTWGRAMTINEVDAFTQALRAIGASTLPQFANARRLYEVSVPERNERIFNYAIGVPFVEDTDIDIEGSSRE